MTRSQKFAFLSVQACCLVQPCCATCPAGWLSHNGRCFHATRARGTFVDCQHICRSSNGSLVTITDETVNALVYGLVKEGGDRGAAFIGLYEAPPDESGNWVWVDGNPSAYRNWQEGEPNNWCVDEDCAIFLLPHDKGTGKWYDASCAIVAQCICESGTKPSADYTAMEREIALTPPPDYSACEGGECFWKRDYTFRVTYAVVGLPCFFVFTLAILTSCCGLRVDCQSAMPGEMVETEGSVPSSHYGILLDASDALVDVDEVVAKWICRGAFAAILYSAALLGLAVTMGLHTNGVEFSFMVDAVEAFIMFICKFCVALSAHTVHKHMSITSRNVVGKWVKILGLSKLLMALCALALAFVYLFVSLFGAGGSVFCFMGYIFCWSMLISNAFQSLAGISFWMIQRRATNYMGDDQAFYKIMKCWWPVLVLSTFVVGSSLYFCGALFVFDGILSDGEALRAMPFFYLSAALSQFVAGVAMLTTNCKIRNHFSASIPLGASSARKIAIEMNSTH